MTLRILAVLALATIPMAAARAAEPAWHCALTGVSGSTGPAQQVQFQVSGKALKRLRGPDGSGGVLPETSYQIIADDRDTVVAAALDFPPLVTLVFLVRSTGVLKLAVVTNDRTDTIISYGQCRARP